MLHDYPQAVWMNQIKRPAWGGRPSYLEEAVSKRKEGTFYSAMAVPSGFKKIFSLTVRNLLYFISGTNPV
ncbi:hypothetical protein [Desulfovibrio sp. MES5]|uniref:hypothetical protein n=1 Tax=Desulfovibrio sp. MES5 TaxID=1899016 RepID=UPI0025C1F12A|nr:hypothetical protein [Desulfovibrio sp. MES5]